MPFRFEGLEIWQQSREFSGSIFKVATSFPETERFGLAIQLTRAADSICLNIAEGAGRDTNLGFNRFLTIATGSTFEVASALFLALDRGDISQQVHTELYAQAEHLSKSISRFRKTLLAKPTR